MEKSTKSPKMYLDHRGNEIPSNFIHKIDRQKHSAALRLCSKAIKLNQALADFKAQVIEECDELYNESLRLNHITVRSNAKGGYSISTIDKQNTIQVTIAETMSFDDNISIAQELIKQYLDEVTQGIDNGIKILIDEAFKTRKGQLDTKRVLGLLKLEIKHPTWMRAMDLIRKSISVESTKRYITLWTKDFEGKDIQIKLDFNSL